ncbi:MAG TPA: DNA-3-methyladenine glycosylase [Steroidobacteraceae bacterium]|nr:DNA-3-methyladenine glycosylase [Steroidobacteraceae bacterium]
MPRLTRRSLPTSTVALARYLVGRTLVHATPRGRLSGRIVETEAYPPGDPTGYFRPGLTTSNAPLFAARGHGYVRMVYGTCLTLNLAADAEGVGAAVLIRALQPLEGLEWMQRNCPKVRAADLTRGPGRLCAALGIGRELSGVDLCASEVLWLERGPRARPAIQVGTRIGLSRDQHLRLRFVERGSRYLSVPP